MQRYFVVIPDMPVCLSERFVRERRSAMFEHVCVSEFMRESAQQVKQKPTLGFKLTIDGRQF